LIGRCCRVPFPSFDLFPRSARGAKARGPPEVVAVRSVWLPRPFFPGNLCVVSPRRCSDYSQRFQTLVPSCRPLFHSAPQVRLDDGTRFSRLHPWQLRRRRSLGVLLSYCRSQDLVIFPSSFAFCSVFFLPLLPRRQRCLLAGWFSSDIRGRIIVRLSSFLTGSGKIWGFTV